MTPSLQAPPSFTAADGGFVAESLDECVIAQAETWHELRHNVREAVQAYFFDSTPPKFIRLPSMSDRATLRDLE